MAVDVRAQAAAVVSVSDLAQILRELRERLALRGSPLSYRQIAERARISSGAVGIYLTGARLPSEERFTALVEVLGADSTERAALAAAWRRLAAAAAVSVSSPGVARAPRGLPGRPSAFTGRDDQLERLDELLVEAETRPARFVAITGMAGVGKTALALHWAHQATPYFPDGQLYVDVHTYSSGPPLSTMDSLGVLLTALGADLDGLADLATRSLRYQTLLRGRSMVVLLDNVGDASQLVHLLPPAPCVAVVTSRDELADLDDLLQVRRIVLAGLLDGEALELLRSLVGSRVDGEPDAAQALAQRCAYLPLALRIAAEQAVARPQASLDELVRELEEDAGGLDAFEVSGDPRSDLRSVFSWSLHRLPSPLARVFRLLGLIPGFDFDRYGLAALAGIDPAAAEQLARGLVSAHLLEPRVADRFAMHDLLRAYAVASAQRDLDAEDRRAATTRLFDFYLSATTAATDTMYPTDKPAPGRERDVLTSEPHVPEMTEIGAVAQWLQAERANIVAAGVHAARHGWPAHAVTIALQIWGFLEDTYAHDAIALHTEALVAADEPGAADPRDRARLLAVLAMAHYRLGDLDRAGELVEESIAVGRSAGDNNGARLSLAVLAHVRSAQGRFTEVLSAFEQAVDIGRDSGPAAQIVALLNLAQVNLTLERHETSLDHCQQAASLAAAPEFRQLLAEAHRGVAMALVHLGRCAEAVRIAERALEVIREYGYPIRLVTMLDTFAQACRGSGRVAEAISHLEEALQLARDTAGTHTAALVLNTLGETYQHVGEHIPARTSFEEAFELSEQAGNRRERARALVGLGDGHAAAGHLDHARDCWQEALDEYTDMGLPAAARVEARLQDVRP